MNELTSQEMLEINGGVDGDTIVAGGTIVGMATSAAIGLGGKTIMSMCVAACLSCGPIGWAIVGIVTAGGLVGGYLIGKGLISN